MAFIKSCAVCAALLLPALTLHAQGGRSVEKDCSCDKYQAMAEREFKDA